MSQAIAADQQRPKKMTRAVELSGSHGGRLADYGLIIAFLSLTFLLGIFPLKDTDFWWHLKAGDSIRQTGQVPTVDTFTFGAEGHPWIDLHWIFQILVSWGYEHGGVVGLNLAKCAITTLAVFLLITAKRREWPVWAMLLAWLPALLVLNGRMYIRPETMSLLYLAMVLAILSRWGRKPWLAFVLPLVQVCWVNTQGLFLLEPILIGFALADAVTRPGAFLRERRGWWRMISLATVLTGAACFFNPYGLAGTFYPIQLARTMTDPIFKETIWELKPLPTFIEEVGLDSLPLKLHIAAFGFGFVSFLLPAIWRLWVALVDRVKAPELDAEFSKGRKKRESARAKKRSDDDRSSTADSWRLSPFRGLLFAAFSALSLAATRNSHQFAAVVGTVTAWNFGEWAWAIRARKLRLGKTLQTSSGTWPRLITFVAIALTFAAVVSGRFYAWSGEGRTVGIGEESLWFPHEAVKFAGGPGMPDRMVGYHNGHPALYEYYWAPQKKTYTDARLEVMGPELYKEYLGLERKIRFDSPGWSQDLEKMGQPAFLIDNLQQGNAALSASLLKSRHWRCVWFDPIACVFVHDSYEKIVEAHAVDFAGRHFRREADASIDGPATLMATSQALRFIGSQCRERAGGETQAQVLLRLGLEYSRKLRSIAPRKVDGWKQAGMIEYIRDFLQTKETIPRYRLPFDPVFDLPLARATYDLKKALEIKPDDGPVIYCLADLFRLRDMCEPALPLMEEYAEQPNINVDQQKAKGATRDQAAILLMRLGATPSTKWANLNELDQVIAGLMETGRVSTLESVMQSAYRPEARPWEWADRLAVLQFHLGEPAKARVTWLAASTGTPVAPRLARIAATYLVEGDFESSRKFYRDAIAADPGSCEAHYGLATLELDAGYAAEATEHGQLAEKAATTDHARSAARTIVEAAAPYAARPTNPARDMTTKGPIP
jgi:tetratricopeptide (TPR) repeat protein